MKQKILKLLKELNRHLIDKHEVNKLMILSLFSGEALFLLGESGLGKSLVAKRMKMLCESSHHFEYIFARETTMQEIFGSLNLTKLNNGYFQQKNSIFLQDAQIVFLDRIWKSNPQILNTLLTLLDQRDYAQANSLRQFPLQQLIAASNHLPINETSKLLFERFLLRYRFSPFQSEENFYKLISIGAEKPLRDLRSFDTLKETDFLHVSRNLKKILLPQAIQKVLYAMKEDLAKFKKNHNLKKKQISNRKWVKIVKLLKTSAFLNDRRAVDYSDLFILKNVLWNEEKEISLLNSFLKTHVFSYFKEISTSPLVDEIAQLINFLQEKDYQKIQAKYIHQPKLFYKIIDFDGNFFSSIVPVFANNIFTEVKDLTWLNKQCKMLDKKIQDDVKKIHRYLISANIFRDLN